MRYSDKACGVGEPQLRSKSCVDAFSHFTRVLSRNKELVDMMHTARQKTGNQAALDQPPSEDRTGVKVYVLPVPDALTDDLVTCYREKRGENPWDDTQPHGNCDGRRTCDDCDRGNECSEALGVETAQHASDIWLHRGLLKHSAARITFLSNVPFDASILLCQLKAAPNQNIGANTGPS